MAMSEHDCAEFVKQEISLLSDIKNELQFQSGVLKAIYALLSGSAYRV